MLDIRLANSLTARTLQLRTRVRFDFWDTDESTVAEVTGCFTWMDSQGRRKTMLLNKQKEVYFTYVLEQIGDCPCWEDGKGRCELDIDVFLD